MYTIDHDILYQKVENYGIRGSALNLFKSYLSNISQFIEYDNCISYFIKVNFGIPYISVFRPILFLIYDLHNILTNCITTIYADDTNLIFSCNM